MVHVQLFKFLIQLISLLSFRSELNWQLGSCAVVNFNVAIAIRNQLLHYPVAFQVLLQIFKKNASGLGQVYVFFLNFNTLAHTNTDEVNILALKLWDRLTFYVVVGPGVGPDFEHGVCTVIYQRIKHFQPFNHIFDLCLCEAEPFLMKFILAGDYLDHQKVLIRRKKIKLFKKSFPRNNRVLLQDGLGD